MSKQSGAPCPSCKNMPCAEFAQIGQEPRWTCNHCGAGGVLAGSFTGRGSPAPASKPASKKHWRDAGKGLVTA